MEALQLRQTNGCRAFCLSLSLSLFFSRSTVVYRNGEVLYFVSPCTSLFHCPERRGEWKYCPPGWICLFSRIRRIFVATATDGFPSPVFKKRTLEQFVWLQIFPRIKNMRIEGQEPIRRDLKLLCDSFRFPSPHKPLIVSEELLCTSACQLLTK